MADQNLSIVSAYIAGLVAFFSPCLLPLLPSYFSIITGFTFKDLYGLNFDTLRGRVFLSTVFFVMGFSLIFTMLGLTSTVVGSLLLKQLPFLVQISGAVLIILGMIQVGIIKFEGLQFDYAWNVQKKLARFGYVTAFITGMTYALIWIPCVGAVLGAILIFAAQASNTTQGALLLFSFSIGLGTPFVLLGLFFPVFFKLIQEHRILLHRISILGGVVLVCFGAILLFNLYPLLIQLFGIVAFGV